MPGAAGNEPKSQIHELTISLRFLGIIFSVFRLEVSVYCTMFTLQTSFKPLFLKGVGGEKSVSRGDYE